MGLDRDTDGFFDTDEIDAGSDPADPADPLPPRPCIGDCNEDGTVTVDELIRGVDITVGRRLVDECKRLDSSNDGDVTMNELLQVVSVALQGCVVSYDY